MRSARVPLAVVAALAVLAVASPLAEAHAVPTSASPASGSVVRLPPREVLMTFSEPLEPALSTIQVRDADGTAVSEPSTVDADGTTIRAGMPPGLRYGTYSVAWRALSTVDGHTTRGLASFLYPDPSKPVTLGDLPPAEQPPELLAGPEDAVLRGVAFTGMFAALGLPVLLLVVLAGQSGIPGGPAGRSLGLAGAVLAAAAALATLLAAVSQAADAAGVGFASALLDPAGAFSGRFGNLAAVRAGLLIAAAAACLAAGRGAAGPPAARRLWGTSALAAAGAFATVSLTSHAAALRTFSTQAVVLDWLHLVAAAVWVGALAGLAWLLRRRAEGALDWFRAATRFSAIATLAVAVVVLTGVAAALVHVPTLAALVGTAYGQVLLVKVALVAGLLGFGAYHKFLAVPRLGRHDAEPAGSRESFRKTASAEATLGVAVILVAAVLSATSPPAALGAPATGPPPVFEASQVVEGVNATLIITPAPVRVGLSTVDIHLTRLDGTLLTEARNATLTFFPPDRSLGSNEQRMDVAFPGHFATEGAFFTMPGNWTVRASVQRTGGFDVVVDYRVAVVS